MRFNEHGPIGVYFDEITLGTVWHTRGRTITEADVVNFAALTGDYNPMHTNAHYAEHSAFGKRVAHGDALPELWRSGQMYQLGVLEQTIIAFRGLEAKFSLPVLIGDTLQVKGTVTDLKPMSAHWGGECHGLRLSIINQDGKVVQKGTWEFLMANKPTEPSAS
ncbi:MAG UNVERIFIED_CONTAM: MaoC family dehydratase N-terminal domain-containing protein [Anaerolineae bacterium]